MWRLRVTPLTARTASSCSPSALRVQWFPTITANGRRNFSSMPWLRSPPYGITVPIGSIEGAMRSMMVVGTPHNAKRFFRAQSRGPSDSAEEKSNEPNKASATQEGTEEATTKEGEGVKQEEGKGDKEGAEGATAAPEQKGIRGQIDAFKRDFHEFPDIYNSANAINFVLFTIFCLCSTGSNVEAEWWIDQFGIDAAFRPMAWFMHSIVMNNFLSMTFAMMLLHSMCHSVLPTIGSAALFQYCAIISVVSGVVMWAFNYSIGYTKEKQFGPWDIVAGLFVMQFLHQGFLPWQIINGFNGWVRYACWVGTVCILYFDPQPTALGTALGFALCRFHPRFKPGAAAAAAGGPK